MPDSLIVALSENRVIGRDGRLPWHLRADLQRFKRLTMGHTIVMGRKTFESIGRPLPGRNSIVLTRQEGYAPSGVRVAPSLEAVAELAAGDSQVFFIGGGEVYRQVLPQIGRIYLTLVHAQVAGDAHFPELPPDHWRLVERDDHGADANNDYPYSFLIYERVKDMTEDVKRELLSLTERLLASIAARDWATYQTLCDPSLTAFEPEARGELVEGLGFHKYYFDLGGARTPSHNTICSPQVRLLGEDAAVVTYVRLTQHVDGAGAAQTAKCEETRVWHRQDGRWQHVHFHRSTNA